MTEPATTDSAFLRCLLAAPHDSSLREMYADFLEEHLDAREEYLRLPRPQEQFTFIDWIASSSESSLDYYVETFPELTSSAETWRREQALRQQIESLQGDTDPAWTAFMNTLANPFQPACLWNNTGPVTVRNEDLPFTSVLGRRGSLMTFIDSFNDPDSWLQELMADLDLLMSLQLGDCASGAASCPLHPFACETPEGRDLSSGRDILAALRAADFRSDHIASLDELEIEYPGYHPSTANDEIHNSFGDQMLFPIDCVDEASRQQYIEWGIDPDVPKRLQSRVIDEKLWYLLLHSWSTIEADAQKGPWVVLFAVGQSLDGRRLLGVISHQMCHNLCD